MIHRLDYIASTSEKPIFFPKISFLVRLRALEVNGEETLANVDTEPTHKAGEIVRTEIILLTAFQSLVCLSRRPF